MATVVRKGTRAVPNGCVEEPSATWDWRVPAWRGDTDAATARAARERQTAWRRDHPAAWRAQLERLVHFEPAYRYDPTHEYTDDWTTDPDYGADVHRLDYDEDGFVCSPHHRHTPCLMALLDVLADLLGNRVEHEAELHFPARSTGQSQVVPDLMVLPPACELPAGMERNKEGRTVRLDEGHPLPELVAEIVSPTSEVRDLEDKLALYAALGIVEYLACYPGDLPDPDAGEPGSPAELRLFQLQPDGTYRQAMDAAACFSRVCGTQVRLWQPDVRRMARFQWWDEARGRWRDPVADAEHTREVERDRHDQKLQETRTESLKEGEARGEAKMAVAALHSFLPALPTRNRGQVAAHWYRHGPPADAMDRILAVRETPHAWRSLLMPDTPVGLDDNGR
ncbi:MAG: Uma2 family endonuclease [Caldilineaceae bacterium]|nr:Uma2 family endonuclease [Caldilineaceae bacterium]